MAGPVRISILADGSRARREFSQTARSGSRLGSILGKAGKAAALGLGVGLLAAAAGAKKFAEAAAQDEQAAGLLAKALKNSANATAGQIASTEKWITVQGKSLGVTDDELRPALSRLVTATKDVGKAQKLASLAMDVSAGTGKSLESVSTALMKAQNGQVSSLSRLGINTKNAKGETITMERAVRRMADTFGGSASTKAQTLQGRLDRLKVMASEAGEELGGKLLEGIERVTPTLEDLAGWVKDNRDEFEDFGTSVKDQALPVIKTLAELVRDGAKAVHSLPAPVKETTGKVLLAAIAFRGLSSAIAAVRGTALITSLASMATGLRATETRATALKGALRGAAGAGGMLMLMQAMQKTENQAKGFNTALDNVAAGALIGFSVGGPVGGAVGTVGGLGTAFKDLQIGVAKVLGVEEDFIRTTPAAIDVTARWKTAVGGLSSTFDSLNGSLTGETRRLALEELEKGLPGVTTGMQGLGVSARTLSQAAVGNEQAMRRVLAAFNAVADVNGNAMFNGKTVNAHTLSDAIGNVSLKTSEARKLTLQNIAVTKDYGKTLNGLPKTVRAYVKAEGIKPTTRGVAEVVSKFKLVDKKKIRALIEASGVETTVKRVQSVAANLKKVDGTKATLKGWLSGLKTAIAQGAKVSDSERRTIVTKLEAIEKAHPDLSPYVDSVRTAVQNASLGARGSTAVGEKLKSGLLSGMYGTSSALSAIMSGAVRDAIAAARREADINSPSRKTYEIGELMGQGLLGGLAARVAAARKGGRSLAASVLAGVTGGSAGVDKALTKITQLIEKRIKGKGEDKRQRAVLRGLKDEFRQLKLNGKAQDRVTSALEKQRGRLRELVSASRAYAATIKQGFVDYGNVVGLGVRDGSSSVSLSGLLSQLKARAAASERFSALIAQLTQARLNQTSLQQLLAAGVDGGLATAEAIASGGSAAISQINQLTAQIGQQGGALGTAMANKFHAAGIRAAQGLVDGLEKRQAQLDRAGQRMASALVKQLGKELGVKTGGPRGGLDWSQTHARRTPALDAYRGRPAGHQAVTVVNHITVNAPVGVSQMEVGRTVVKAIDVYFKAGGTTQTIVKRGTTS